MSSENANMLHFTEIRISGYRGDALAIYVQKPGEEEELIRFYQNNEFKIPEGCIRYGEAEYEGERYYAVVYQFYRSPAASSLELHPNHVS